MEFKTIQVKWEEDICSIRLNRPDRNNAINDCMVEECSQVIKQCEEKIKIIVLEGLKEVFCSGADFQDIYDKYKNQQPYIQNPEPLYQLWVNLSTGPYITISHVKGKVNAGGIGFVASSDIVLADQSANFSLSELLFGVYPACVLPFLVRRVGYQKAHYMTLMTKCVQVEQALAWGLVDDFETNSENLLRRHLIRLKCISKQAVIRYKSYMNCLRPDIISTKNLAVQGNMEAFSNKDNIRGILKYVEDGVFPWEK